MVSTNGGRAELTSFKGDAPHPRSEGEAGARDAIFT
jgi:hypothetical protein